MIYEQKMKEDQEKFSDEENDATHSRNKYKVCSIYVLNYGFI